MTQSDANVHYSEDRNYWWDEHHAVWQPVDATHVADATAVAAAETGSGAGSGSPAPAPAPQPALITLAGGESKWDPDPVPVGHAITVTWREYNEGGPSAAYSTNVALKKGNDIENEVAVQFDPLGAHQAEWRTAELKGPLTVDLDYAIEIFVDADNAPFHNERNWAHMEIEVRG